MNSKIFSVFALSIFAFLFAISFASADMHFNPTSINNSVDVGTTNITINFQLIHDEFGSNYTSLAWSGATNQGIWTSLPDDSTLNINETANYSATLIIDSSFSGTITAHINVNNTATGQSPTEDLPITITVNPISSTETLPSDIQDCNTTGMPSDIDVRIKKIDISNDGLQYTRFGEDNKWFPFETIHADIQVKNYGNYDVDTVEVLWGVYDVDTQQWVIEPDTFNDFRLKHGDTETVSVDFNIDDNVDVDLTDINDGDTLRFYATATGQVDDQDSVSDGQDFCTYKNDDSEMIIERDFVILTNIQIPQTVQCGETLDVTATAWNVGDRDQNDVSVELFDKENLLGINQVISVGDIDAFDSQSISFSYKIPASSQEKNYRLEMDMLDEDGSIYQDNFNDDYSKFIVPFAVSGKCVPDVASITPSITANLVSEAKAGQDVLINLVITNPSDESVTYFANILGYSEWASSAVLDSPTFTLGPGETRNLLATVSTNDDVYGVKTFNLELSANGVSIISQPVSVTLEKASGLSGLSGITGFSILENKTAFALGLLNVLLILVIIIVAVKVSRK